MPCSTQPFEASLLESEELLSGAVINENRDRFSLFGEHDGVRDDYEVTLV